MSGDAWILGIEKWIPEKVAGAYLESGESGLSSAASLFDRYGRNILVGAKEFIGSLRSEINTYDNTALRDRLVESILKAVGESNSRVHRALGVAFLLHMLSDQALQDNNNDRSALPIKVDLLVKGLLEPANYAETETNVIALEQVLANCFYEKWKGIDHSEGVKNLSPLLYLSLVASSVAIDVLASADNARLVDSLTEQLVEHVLGIRLKNRGIHDRPGLYQPAFAPLIDYPVLFLAAYLSQNGIALDRGSSDGGRILRGIVDRLSNIRLGMAWTGLTDDGAPVDGILTSNITLMCDQLELTRDSQDIQDWGESDVARLHLCATPDLAPQSILSLIKSLAFASPEEHKVVLRQLQIGISLHSASWQQLVLELFSSEVLHSIIDSDEAQKELVEFCAHLWLWRDTLSKNLASQIDSVLYALPGDGFFASGSLRDQGRVLALISHWEADPGSVGEWLVAIGQSKDLDNNEKRAVFREFIFDEVCRPKLRSTLETMLQDEDLATYWEFRWLRHLVEDCH